MNRILTYRLPTLEDRDALCAYVEEHYTNGEHSISTSMHLTSMGYDDWVAQINRNAEVPNGDWGRSYTLLCFGGEKLVGLLSIRFELTEELIKKYGHIGYGVRPGERRKGYASAMLRYALSICREKGLKQVEAGCFRENEASAKTLIRNGGKLVRESEDCSEGKMSQYYLFEL